MFYDPTELRQPILHKEERLSQKMFELKFRCDEGLKKDAFFARCEKISISRNYIIRTKQELK